VNATLMAYIPFVAPISLFYDWWPVLAVPLSFGIAMIYKALRITDLSDLGQYWRQVATMTVQIVLGMVALGAALFVLVQWIVPRLPVS
jgi:hypothetical protein